MAPWSRFLPCARSTVMHSQSCVCTVAERDPPGILNTSRGKALDKTMDLGIIWVEIWSSRSSTSQLPHSLEGKVIQMWSGNKTGWVKRQVLQYEELTQGGNLKKHCNGFQTWNKASKTAIQLTHKEKKWSCCHTWSLPWLLLEEVGQIVENAQVSKVNWNHFVAGPKQLSGPTVCTVKYIRIQSRKSC